MKTQTTMTTMTTLKRLLDKLPPWTLTIVCFLAICWLTLAPHPLPDNDLPLFPGADKIAHAIMFGGFTLCIILDWNRRHGWPTAIRKPDYYAPFYAELLGIVTELLQQKMNAGRSGDTSDLIADTAGSFLVCGAVCLYKKS
ncbi:MAG: VanZ family protein, partial [Muribaculaceae bacterium]|nr:VanZ family protein [Muribaculaceae bacterium]